MKNTPLKYSIGAAIALLTAFSASSNAATPSILDNIGNDPAGSSMVANFGGGEGIFTAAQGFTTGSNSYTLTSVSLLFNSVSGIDFQLGLYSNDGNTPGSQLALFAGPGSPEVALNIYAAPSNITLDPLTQYWLVASTATMDDMFFVTMTDDLSYVTTDGWSMNSALGNFGGGWMPQDSTVIQFSVNVTGQTVPEPSSVALAGLGGLAILFYRRQK